MFGIITNGLCILLFIVLMALILLTGGFLVKCLRGQGQQSQIPMTDIKLTAHDFHLVIPTNTVGHEKLTITNEAQLAFDWQMQWDATWLNVQPAAGTIIPSTSETIQIDFDAMSLPPDTYITTLIITSNLDEPIEVQITLNVTWHNTYLPLVINEESID
jgi:hypothetical protein